MPMKVWIPLLLILGGISWLAFSNLSKANYFYTVDELAALDLAKIDYGMKVKGRIVEGSIKDKQKPIEFVIHENGAELAVRYVGTEPLPDLFKDRAEAVVEGRLAADGVFDAKHLQAKCASKFEAEAPGVEEGKDFQADANADANADKANAKADAGDYAAKPATEPAS